MTIEEELKTSAFKSSIQKAQLNILFTSCWIKGNLANVLKPFGLTAEQYNVLRILQGSYPNVITLKEISKRMVDRNSNTSRIVDRLENKGFLERTQNNKDRRSLGIALSKNGKDFMDKLMNVVTTEVLHPSNLTEEESHQLSMLLDKMRN